MTTSVCSRCGGPLTASASGEYCPRCAGRLLLDTAQDDVGVSQPSTLNSQHFSLRLGEYELGAELGRGAMGVVYRARQPRLRREVAVKVILASRFAGESARKRFLAEAELAAQLDHPNIVPIYEVGETPDGPFYAMKLVEGGTLAERMSNDECRNPKEAQNPKHELDAASKPDSPFRLGPSFDIRHSTFVISKIARAVHHAHQRGVLHRDLKPGNILIDAQGEPHVTDFGLARQIGVESSLTLSGSTLGTPAYMAPEQARGEKTVTTASDVWSLGAILYHLLAGRPPFPGDTAVEVLRKVMEEEPVPPSQLRSSRREEAHSEKSTLRAPHPTLDQSLVTSAATKVDRDLEIICLKCLEKDPARRYSSALRLAEDLQRWHRHEPIEARPVSSAERLAKWARRRPAIAALSALAVVLFVAGSVGIAWQWRRATGLAEESRQRLVRMTTTSGLRKVEERDLLGALPWFVEALRLDSKSSGSRREEVHPSNVAAHRIRFATALRQSPRLVQVWFHDDAVRFAEFSPDGSRVATAGADGTARVWDAITGQPITPPLRHARGANQAIFSRDGKRIATASGDGTARIWDAQSGEPLTPPMVHPSDMKLVLALSPDGNILVTAAESSTPVFWNARTGERLATTLRDSIRSYLVLFSPEGQRILTARYGTGTAQVWDVATGASVGTALKYPGVRTVAFSPEGGRIVIGGDQQRAEIRNATNGLALTPPLRHGGAIAHAEFSPDGTRVLTASFDGTARVWDAATGQPVTPPLQHATSLHHAAFSPDGRWVVTASEDHTAQVWDAVSGTALFPPLWHGHSVERAVFSPDGRRLLTASLDGLVRLWDLAASAPATVILAGESKFKRAMLNRGRLLISSVSEDNTVQVWDVLSGTAVGPLLKPQSTCKRAVLSPDGARIATALDRRAQVWDVATGKLISQVRHGDDFPWFVWRPDGHAILSVSNDDTSAQIWNPDTGATLLALEHGEEIKLAAFSPNTERVATGSNVGTGRIWNAATGQAMTSPLRHNEAISAMCFSPDGQRLATCSHDSTARIWDAGNGQPLTPPLRHGGWVNDITFNLDGRRVMTTSDDGTARVWDAATGQPVTPPLRVGGGVHHPMFSRDGRLVLAGNGYVVQVWDAHSGTPVTPPFNPHVPMLDVAFSADERGVIAVTLEGRVLSWDITPFDWPLEDLAAAARLLSCREIDATGAPVPLEQMMEGAPPALAARSSESTRTNDANDDVRTTNAALISAQASDGPSSARALLRRDWERLKPRLSSQSAVSNLQSQIAWHTEQAAAAEVSQQWFAAAFHLDRLCAIRTNDIELRQHRDRVREHQIAATGVRDTGENVQQGVRSPNAQWSAINRVPPRAPATPARLIDLTPHYTFALTNSLHVPNPDNSFSALPAGITNLAGVDFDVRGVVHLAGSKSLLSSLPESVRGVRVGLKATRLHLLHACSQGASNTHIASLVVHYTNALHTEIPIVYGRDVRDWHARPNEPPRDANAKVAWRGTNAHSIKYGESIRLFKTTWSNPIPGMEILSLDYVSKLAESAPFLIAITAEE